MTLEAKCCCEDPKNRQGILAKQSAIFKALGHPVRLTMVYALTDGPRCVCDLHALVEKQAPKDLSTISRHLSTLQQAGIISSERRGTNIYYTLTLHCLGTFLHCTCDNLTA